MDKIDKENLITIKSVANTVKGQKIMVEDKKKQNMEDKETFEERQYQRLIEARNFHYENFNKWSLYFYAIIAALFIGFYSIKDNMILSCVIALVGYVVSICCYLSGKGYYYWEISWIKLVQACERRLIVEKEKKSYYVYSLFVEKDKSSHPTSLLEGSNISSSKLSLLMSFVISSAWGYLLFTILAHVIWGHLRSSIGITKPLCFCCKTFWELLVGIAAIGITCCVVKCMAKCTKLHSDMNKLDEAFENQELKVYLTK